MAEEIDVLPLIRTKLQHPRLPGELIRRCGLLDRKLNLISAQAGAGKTTLLAQWLDECPHAGAWFSLNEHDIDLTILLGYSVGVVRTVVWSTAPAKDRTIYYVQREPHRRA